MSGTFDPKTYGPVVAELLDGAGPMPLNGGTENAEAGARLRGLTARDLFPHGAPRDPELAASCLSALWLRHGFLDESHRLSQGIPSAEGSFWHGIMHRREGDYPNAKYWFRRVGSHPLFPDLQAAAREIAAQGDGPAARAMAGRPAWDPNAFIDLCEIAVTHGKPDDPLWCAVQRAEWELLFDSCWRGAEGR
jgi:hypothetical protein